MPGPAREGRPSRIIILVGAQLAAPFEGRTKVRPYAKAEVK
jgi:hypothetical protein